MPLTPLQAELARLLSATRAPDSYLCGGAALHLKPNTLRYSHDLDFFHDSEKRVAAAFAEDRKRLGAAGWGLVVELSQPGYILATVTRGDQATKVEWAHDSAWRFLPTLQDEVAGYILHPVDLAINKVLALAGRDEARDFLDVVFTHRTILPFGAQCWAAPGKDPGFSPGSLLELLRRRGKHRPEDFRRLHLAQPVDLPALKAEWLEMLENAARFIASRPPEEAGCLYWDPKAKAFVEPTPKRRVLAHYGRPQGVLPRLRFD